MKVGSSGDNCTEIIDASDSVIKSAMKEQCNGFLLSTPRTNTAEFVGGQMRFLMTKFLGIDCTIFSFTVSFRGVCSACFGFSWELAKESDFLWVFSLEEPLWVLALVFSVGFSCLGLATLCAESLLSLKYFSWNSFLSFARVSGSFAWSCSYFLNISLKYSSRLDFVLKALWACEYVLATRRIRNAADFAIFMQIQILLFV